jgi:hypothetical protein
MVPVDKTLAVAAVAADAALDDIGFDSRGNKYLFLINDIMDHTRFWRSYRRWDDWWKWIHGSDRRGLIVNTFERSVHK